MGQTVTLAEAILISIATLFVWVLIKTILQSIERDVKRKEELKTRFKGRSFKTYHNDLWYGDESQDEIKRMLEEVNK